MATNLMYVLDLKIVQSIFSLSTKGRELRNCHATSNSSQGAWDAVKKKSEESGFPGSFPNVSKWKWLFYWPKFP